MTKFRCIIALLLLFHLSGQAQLQKFTLNGYIKDLYMYYQPGQTIPGIDISHLSSNLVHNRMNFRWYASDNITAALEVRNRLFSGQLIREFPEYEGMVDTEPGYLDLSATVVSNKSWFLHTMVDRAWIQYIVSEWQITAGRQRINWGINLVWNPNDIFNTFSYFDFDYEERPGSDALSIQYYTGVTSSAELVYKIGRNEMNKAVSTFAAKYRFSKFGYDVQFLGGRMPEDMVLGTGWSGNVKGAAFRGEASWFIPHEKVSTRKSIVVVSVSGDYTFKNSLYIHSSLLYNSSGVTGKAGTREFFEQNISVKNLSPAQYNLFAQVSYPFTPLITGSISGIINPSDGSSYLGPSVNLSLGNNLELMATGQLFLGDEGTEYGELGKAIYGRLKWSF